MKNLTRLVRGIPAAAIVEASRAASQRKTSVNRVLVEWITSSAQGRQSAGEGPLALDLSMAIARYGLAAALLLEDAAALLTWVQRYDATKAWPVEAQEAFARRADAVHHTTSALRQAPGA
jgi:hypothetical protein